MRRGRRRSLTRTLCWRSGARFDAGAGKLRKSAFEATRRSSAIASFKATESLSAFANRSICHHSLRPHHDLQICTRPFPIHSRTWLRLQLQQQRLQFDFGTNACFRSCSCVSCRSQQQPRLCRFPPLVLNPHSHPPNSTNGKLKPRAR